MENSHYLYSHEKSQTLEKHHNSVRNIIFLNEYNSLLLLIDQWQGMSLIYFCFSAVIPFASCICCICLMIFAFKVRKTRYNNIGGQSGKLEWTLNSVRILFQLCFLIRYATLNMRLNLCWTSVFWTVQCQEKYLTCSNLWVNINFFP